MVGFLIPILISLAINILAYMLMPKPKTAKPEATKEMEDPKVSAGTPIPKVFGTMLIKSPNILWFGEKQMIEYKVK